MKGIAEHKVSLVKFNNNVEFDSWCMVGVQSTTDCGNIAQLNFYYLFAIHEIEWLTNLMLLVFTEVNDICNVVNSNDLHLTSDC